MLGYSLLKFYQLGFYYSNKYIYFPLATVILTWEK